MRASPTPGELHAIAKDRSAALALGYGELPFIWKYKVVAVVYEFQKGPRMVTRGRSRPPVACALRST